MLNLSIECSGLYGSVALSDQHEVLGVQDLPRTTSSGQSLASAIQTLIAKHGSRPKLISVTCGPGSFTGLRVGLTVAKMLGWAWQIPIVPVDTLQVIAQQALENVPRGQAVIVVPAINAFRKQVFTSAWQLSSDGQMLQLAQSQVVDAAIWMLSPLVAQPQAVPTCDDSWEIWVAGPGLTRYPTANKDQRWGAAIRQWPEMEPHARWVAQIGWHRYLQGFQVEAHELAANYIRASAAEESSKI
jgi:tRNA threonylcarbamoyladenosine biosynthesis protein TsaB